MNEPTNTEDQNSVPSSPTPNDQPKRWRRRRKIRNLVPSSRTPNNKSKCCGLTRKRLVFAGLTVTLGILIFYFDNVAELHRRLRGHVERQYNFHTYGTMDYCSQKYQPETLTEPLKLHIINQNDAINEIIGAIQTLDGGVSLALVGGSGVGKTLTGNILQTKFQWPSNVAYFVWSNVRSTSSQYYKIMNLLNESWKTCGAHLVIFDNIEIEQSDMIQELNDEIRAEFRNSDRSALVVFIVNLPSYSDQDLKTLEENRRKLNDLRGIKTINFRSFDRSDVERCIGLESEKLKVCLNDEEISEISEYIDSSRSGCKLVHSKIALYTTT